MLSGTDIISTAMVAALVSFIACLLILLTQRWHGSLSLDSDTKGVQKFHTRPVPRIGGVAILFGTFASALYLSFGSANAAQSAQSSTVMWLLLAGLPAFVAGLVEDMTKKVSIHGRLIATFASALLACWLLGAILLRVDVWGIDALFRWAPFIAITFTVFAVGGVANAVNIIDGFNGIAGSTVIILLAGLGFLAWRTEDMLVLQLALAGAGASLGFLLVNYPAGRLFLGDGGAYLAGFWIAEVAILLIARNPDVNAWQALAVCSYPVIEAMYSIYRKKIVRKSSPALPDRLHMHMLVYRRLVWKLVPRNAPQPWMRNASVASVLAVWIAVSTAAAVLLGDTTSAAVAIVIAQVVAYIAFYTRLVRGTWRIRSFRSMRAAPQMRRAVKMHSKLQPDVPVRESA
ncbi:glycosyltransferase [Noviherbaspirillum sp. CPCC 100848]|uniref:Glycosyltransferase n=1 Tax=Noviherbaspirillum album TaxID=3080276 RepID=A0ABU6J6Z2_9BURK|nr:glycosyltransferase [Noviherbaspirillum sp. CPCC 100848]MEC4719295.1 glycosyltransferase [Noviherbaspirillum sp. CPCC 100848]